MTTSYERSLRLKELGVEQEGGEYYWVDRNGDLICSRCRTINDKIICRALTLGELVRELSGDKIVEMRLYTEITGLVTYLRRSGDLFGKESTISPEEAAGELLAELKQKEG